MQFSKRVSQISPSSTLAITALAKKLISEGIDVISFGAGEPDLPPGKVIIDAAIEAANKPAQYADGSGILPLREAIVSTYEKDFGVSYNPDEVLVSCGGKGILIHSLLATVDPGDEVIIPTPYWVSYPEQVKTVGGIPVFAKCSQAEGFQITADEISGHINNRTKVIMLNTPSNPTGAVLTRKNLTEIAELAVEKGIWLIVDECYNYFVYENSKHVPVSGLSQEIKEQTIVAGSLSKTFAIPGWRVGYSLANAEVTKTLKKLSSHTITHTSTISQWAAAAALEKDRQTVQKMLSIFKQRRSMVMEKLDQIPGIKYSPPQGAFYFWIDVSKYFSSSFPGSDELAMHILEQGKVAVVPGKGFGDDRYLRLSYTQPENKLKEGIDRIAATLEALS